MRQLRYILLILLLPCSVFMSNAEKKMTNTFYIRHNSASLPLIGIRINNGAKYTNNKNIEVEVRSLKTDKSLLESMKIGFKMDYWKLQTKTNHKKRKKWKFWKKG